MSALPQPRRTNPVLLGVGYVAGLLVLIGMVAWMTLRLRTLGATPPPAPPPASALNPQQAADEQRRCEGAAQPDRRDDCWFGLATSVVDLALCRRIESAQWRDTCVLQIAVGTLNRAGCKDIRNADDRRLCEERIPKGGE